MAFSRIITKGATSQSVELRAVTTATGAPVTITSATGGLSLWYRRGGTGLKVAITASDLALLSTAWADGGLLLIGDGVHRLDVADAAFATGAANVTIGGSATGINIEPCDVQLTGADLQDAVHLGITGIPNAAAGAANGLLISGSNAGTTTFGALTVTGATTLTGAVSTGTTVTMTGALVLTGGLTYAIDGVNFTAVQKGLLAVLGGKMSVVDNGNGTSTFTFRNQADNANVIAPIVNNSTSARTTTVTPS